MPRRGGGFTCVRELARINGNRCEYMGTGAGGRRKHAEILFRLLLFSSRSWKRDHQQGEENQGAGSWEEKGESKNNHREAESAILEKQKHECSTQRVLEDVEIKDTRQPRYVLFSATFSCLGVGCRMSTAM